MSLSDLASLGSFVSGLAVLASLVFLFFQIRQMTEQVRQTERNQQALIRQSGRTRSIELFLTRTEPSAADAIAKGTAGDEDISATQFQQFTAYTHAHLINLEDVFYQHENGLLTDSAFAAPRRGYHALLSRPGTRQFWEDMRYAFPPEFAKFVDDLVADGPLRSDSNRLNQWKAGVAAKKTKALED